MKKIVLIPVLLLLHIASFSQRTISLDEFRIINDLYDSGKNSDSLDNIYENITYVKDVSNRLDKFAGTWKGYWNSRHYQITFIKKVNFNKIDAVDVPSFDMLLGWLTVKDSSNGQVLFTNSDRTEKTTQLFGTYFSTSAVNSTYVMSFVGRCYNEAGSVYLTIKADGRMTLSFGIKPDTWGKDCPSNLDPILPVLPQVVFLTKQ